MSLRLGSPQSRLCDKDWGQLVHLEGDSRKQKWRAGQGGNQSKNATGVTALGKMI